jgi:small GTP-binding protein
MPEAKRLEFVLLGRASVGKSNLTIMFVKNEFTDNYVPTITTVHNKELEVGTSFYNLKLHDTAGLEEHSMIANKYLDSDAFILVYSITDLQRLVVSFHQNCPGNKSFKYFF